MGPEDLQVTIVLTFPRPRSFSARLQPTVAGYRESW